MKIRYLVAATALTLASVAGAMPGDDSAPVTPDVAIARAATAMNGYTAIFRMTVQAVGHVRESIFLDSEENYRDPASLNIEVRKPAIAALTELAGGNVDSLKGKVILVHGTARRVKVGASTGGYYFQTQVAIDKLGDITLAP